MRARITLELRRSLGLTACALAALQACAGTPVAPTHRAASPSASVATPPVATPTAAPTTQPSASATATPGPAASPVQGVLTGLVHVPRAVLADVPGILSNNGGNVLALGSAIISDHGGGIISDHGGGLIGNNGAGLLANNGAGYRLAATTEPDQPALAGIPVVLTDAVGVPVPKPGGGRYEAVTDASGRFAFPALPALPRNHLLVAELPTQRGSLTAFIPRTPAAGAAVDLDLVSTLATTYVYDQYVRAQQDPDVVLDRLPADVEAQTRAAVAKSATVPTTLGAREVSAAVNALRKADPALDDQLETVRRLLLLAGLSNGGVGLSADQVTLKDVNQLGIGPGGDLYLLVTSDRRLYRVDAQGILRVAAGSGSQDPASQDGKRVEQAALGYLREALVDPAGGLLLLDSIDRLDRVSYATPDGILHELARQAQTGAASWTGVTRAPDGTVCVLGMDATGKPLLQTIAADGKLQDAGSTKLPAGTPQLLGFAGPTTLVASIGTQQNYFQAYALGWPGLGSLGAPLAADLLGPFIFYDLAGGSYAYQHEVTAFGTTAARAFRLDRVKPDGSREPLLTAAPEGSLTGIGAATVDRQGRVVLALGNTVARVEGGKLVRLAGGGSKTVDGAPATSVALTGPTGAAVAPNGSVYVIDDGKLLRVGADGNISVAATAVLTRLLSGPDGKLYALRASEAVRVDGETVTSLFSYQGTIDANVVAATADGHLVAPVTGPAGYQLMSYPAQPGATGTLLANLPDAALCGLAFSPADGNLYVTSVERMVFGQASGAAHLYRVPAAGGTPTLVATDPRFGDSSGSGLVADAQGRLYTFSGTTQPTLTRFDPRDGSFRAIAGKGAPLFNGTGGVDTTIQMPRGLAIGPTGDLVFVDFQARQVRRIPAKDAGAP